MILGNAITQTIIVGLLFVVGLLTYIHYDYAVDVKTYKLAVEAFEAGDPKPLTAWRFGRRRDRIPAPEPGPDVQPDKKRRFMDRDSPRRFDGSRLSAMGNGLLRIAAGLFACLMVIMLGFNFVRKIFNG